MGEQHLLLAVVLASLALGAGGLGMLKQTVVRAVLLSDSFGIRVW